MSVERVFAGYAKQFRYIASGFTISTLHAAIYNDAEILVGSGAATSSGSGHYFTVMAAPTSLGLYQVKWEATYGTDAAGDAAVWLDSQVIEVVAPEVG